MTSTCLHPKTQKVLNMTPLITARDGWSSFVYKESHLLQQKSYWEKQSAIPCSHGLQTLVIFSLHLLLSPCCLWNIYTLWSRQVLRLRKATVSFSSSFVPAITNIHSNKSISKIKLQHCTWGHSGKCFCLPKLWLYIRQRSPVLSALSPVTVLWFSQPPAWVENSD